MEVPLRVASASGLVATLSTSCGASGRNLRTTGLVDLGTSLQLMLATAVGALLGGLLAGWVPLPTLQWIFGGMLVYGAMSLVRSLRRRETLAEGEAGRGSSRRTLALLLCGVAGVASGLLGIGGGMLMVPILHLFLRLPFRDAAATSNFMMGVTAVPALLIYAGRGDLDLAVAAPLALGVLIGASLGAYLLARLQARWLKLAFIGLLLWTAAQMIREGVRAW
jgi:hypothetical protein